MLGGGAGYGTTDFTARCQADVLEEHLRRTYDSAKTLREQCSAPSISQGTTSRSAPGIASDQGAGTPHRVSGGLGYIDSFPDIAVDFAVQHSVSGPSATAIIIGFKYHVESTGASSPESE